MEDIYEETYIRRSMCTKETYMRKSIHTKKYIYKEIYKELYNIYGRHTYEILILITYIILYYE